MGSATRRRAVVIAFQEVGVKAVVKGFAQYQAQMGKMEASTKKFGGFLKTGLKVAAVAGAAAVGFSIKAFADFDAEMTKSIAIMGDVSKVMRDDMANAARQMAKETTFSAKDAAESYFFLASAGLDAEASIAALPAVAQFAQAGMFDMALATDLLTDAQSALGLTIRDDAVANMENMVRVSDVLVRANTLANATVQQFSLSLTTEAGAAMKSFNIDVEEGVAVLAAFADQGVKGEKAGSGLSRILRLMTAGAVKNADAYKKLGIRVFDASGNINNMADIIGDLEVALGGMSDAQRVAALDSLGFSARVQGVILPLLGSSEAIKDYEKNLRITGATSEVAEKQLLTFNAQLNLLMSELTDVAIEVGSHIVPALMKLVKLVKGDMIPAIKDKLIPAIKRDFKPILAGLIPLIAALTAALWAMVAPLIAAAAPVVAVGAALAALGAVFFLIEKKTGAFSAAWEGAVDVFKREVLPVLREMVPLLKHLLADALDTVIDLWDNLYPVLQKVGDLLREKVVPIFEKVGRFLLEHKPLLLALGVAVLALTQPWLAVVAVLFVVLAKWDEISEMFTRTIPDAIDRLLDWINKIPVVGQVLEVWLEGVKTFWITTWNILVNTVKTVFALIKNRIETALKVIKGVFDTFKAVFSGDWEEAWNSLKQIFIDIWDGLKEEIGIILKGIVGHFDALWTGITSGAEAMRDNLFAILDVAIGLIENFLQQFASLYNQTVGKLGGFIPGLPKEITVNLGRLGRSVEDVDRKQENLGRTIVRTTKEINLLSDGIVLTNPAFREFAGLNAQVTEEVEGGIPPLVDWGGAAGGAGGAAGEAAESTLSLGAALELTRAMFETTADAAREMADADVEASDLMRIQIGLLQDRLASLGDAGDAEGLLAEAIGITIEHLEDQIAAFDDSEEKLLLFGEGVAGPVTAAFRDMADAISEAESALSGLQSVQTQEEAQLEADITFWELEAQKINEVAGELRGMTQDEEAFLAWRERRLTTQQDALEIVEDEITKLERLLDLEGELSTKDAERLEDYKKERDALEDNIKELEDKIDTMKDLAKTMTADGKIKKGQLDDIEDIIEGLEDERDELKAVKKAHVAEQNALITGRPTIDEWIDSIIGMGIETGLYGQEMENIPPLLEEWWRTHGTMGFEIARTQNNLLLAQREFVGRSTSEAEKWADEWTTAGQDVIDSLDAVAVASGGTAAGGDSFQHGGFVRRTGPAFLHAGELVWPKQVVEHVFDTVAAPRVPALAAPSAPAGGGFTANISVTSQQEAAREIERTMRRVAFGLKGAP